MSFRPVSLRRALPNLIDNAVAYGGQDDVTLVDTPAGVTLEVGDRGPGIPKASREAVFDPICFESPSINILKRRK